jgi:hypothetical protein
LGQRREVMSSARHGAREHPAPKNLGTALSTALVALGPILRDTGTGA